MAKNLNPHTMHRRMRLFELLQKYCMNDLNFKEAKELCYILIEKNPYTYSKHPRFEVKKLDKGVQAIYYANNKTLSIDFETLMRIISHDTSYVYSLREYDEHTVSVKFYQLLSLIGHEMKHFYQFSKANIPSPTLIKNDYDLYLSKINHFIKNGRSNINEYYSFLLSINKFVNSNVKNSYFADIKTETLQKISTGFYFINYHEVDARYSGTNFAIGLIKTMLNDNYCTNYSGVKKMLTNSLILAGQIKEETNGKNLKRDKVGQIINSAVKYANKLVELFAYNKIDKENVKKLPFEQCKNLAFVMSLCNNEQDINKTMRNYSKNCKMLTNLLYKYTNVVNPHLQFNQEYLPEIKDYLSL